jgi:hypothetical protein
LRQFGRYEEMLGKAGLLQVKVVEKIRSRIDDKEKSDDLVPLLHSINCISAGLGSTG